MAGQQRGAAGAVARLAGIEDLAMAGGRPGARPVADMQPPVALGVIEQLPEQDVGARTRRAGEGAMEVTVGHDPSPIVLDLREVGHLGHDAFQAREILGSQQRHREAQGLGLERDPHDAQLLHVRGRHRGNPDASVGLGLDQALALEQTQRLAQRGPADAELLGQRHLGHDGAGRQLPVEDCAADALVDVVGVLAGVGHAPSML
jgi:hypothetical protein